MLLAFMIALFCCLAAARSAVAQSSGTQRPRGAAKTYAGFDSNLYPGDGQLRQLRRSFDYAGYWLNPPPGATATTWAGKRAVLEERGFGFLVLFNGRLEKEIKALGSDRGTHPPAQGQAASVSGSAVPGPAAAALGAADAKLAVAAARREGFPGNTIVFLDQEEGGRLTADQSAYLFAWADGVRAAGFRAGVYCSGIEVPDGKGTISTADDIAAKSASAGVAKVVDPNSPPIALWVYNDECPPSPGCALPSRPPDPALSGAASALVWQYAQSPRRKPIANRCPGYREVDNNCYPPNAQPDSQPRPQTFVDLDTSTSPDPSHGRGQR